MTVAAAGTTQGTAAALSIGTNVITGSNSTAGGILPATAKPGDEVTVITTTAAQTTAIYPPAGAAINALAANASLSMAAVTSATFICISATQSYSTPKTPS